MPSPHYDSSDSSGAYYYTRKAMPRPEGVPAKLPKQLKWQQIHEAAPPPQLPELSNHSEDLDSIGGVYKEPERESAPTVVTPLIEPRDSEHQDRKDTSSNATPLMDDTVKGGD